MYFLILLVIIGFVVCPPTKEELIKRATDLETKLLAGIDKGRSSHPIEVRLLGVEETHLKSLVIELKTVQSSAAVALLENRLSALERRVEETLRKIDIRTASTVTGAARTGAPSTPRTTLSQKSTTQLITSRISTTNPLIKTTPGKISNTCETDFIKKLSQTVKKLNEKIEVLSQQNKEDEAIQLSEQVHQVLLWVKQIENLFIQVNKIVEQVDIIERGLGI